MSHSLSSRRRRYAKAPAELGSLAVGPGGKCLPAWLRRYVVQDKMIAKERGDARLAAYSSACADTANSLFGIISGAREDRVAEALMEHRQQG